MLQAVPLQLPHAGKHFTLCTSHSAIKFVWQLHLIILNRSSGAGAKSVNNGIKVLSHSFYPLLEVVGNLAQIKEVKFVCVCCLYIDYLVSMLYPGMLSPTALQV